LCAFGKPTTFDQVTPGSRIGNQSAGSAAPKYRFCSTQASGARIALHIEIERRAIMEATPEPQRKEIILVADDDPAVLGLVCRVLGDRYKVLRASNGAEAIEQSKDFHGEIPLLLSDFQMVDMTGIDVATTITAQRPTIKVLLMSGYSGGMLVLNKGWHFVPKPFMTSQLLALVSSLAPTSTKSRFQTT
jgi:CheY-like chemotaxis protein